MGSNVDSGFAAQCQLFTVFKPFNIYRHIETVSWMVEDFLGGLTYLVSLGNKVLHLGAFSI